MIVIFFIRFRNRILLYNIENPTTMKRYLVIVVAFVMLAGYSCQQGMDHPGYTLISKKFVREVNADCYYFEHDKSGAKVFKIAALRQLLTRATARCI